MSIFEAEVRHRTGEEDQLTSKVFGSLSILDKRVVLVPFLEALGLSLTESEIPTLTVSLWKMYGDVEPDVIIESTEQMAFIEVKLDSPVSHDQLEKEYRRGMKSKKPFSLFLLNKDFRLPPAVMEAKEHLSKDFPDVKINWVRWQQIYPILIELKSRDALDPVSRSLLSEVLRLLEAKRLRGTMGIKPEWLTKAAGSQEYLSLLCEEIAVIAQELNSRAIPEGLEPVTPGGTASNLDRDGRGASLGDPSGWFPRYLELAYKDSNWIVTQFGHRHLYVRFYLGSEEVNVGFIIACNKGNPQKDILDVQHQLFEKLNDRKDIKAVLIPLYASKASNELTVVDASSTLDGDTLSKFQWLDLRYQLSPTDVKVPAVVETLLSLLLDMRSLVNQVELYPKQPKDLEEEAQTDNESDVSAS